MFRRISLRVLLCLGLLFGTILMTIPASASNQIVFYEMGPQDDCRITYNGSTWDYGSDYVQAGYFAASNYFMMSGMRFENVQIPVGSTIDNAYITFTDAFTDATGQVTTVFTGQVGNAMPFSSQVDFTSRQRTTNQVPWNIPAPWIAGTTYMSPNISNVVQEIVNNGTWTTSGSMVIFWGDINNGSAQIADTCRRAYSYTTGGQYHAPTLSITYDFNGSTYNGGTYGNAGNGNSYFYNGVWYANGTGPEYNNGSYPYNNNYPYNGSYNGSTYFAPTATPDPRVDQVLSDDKAMTASISGVQSSVSDLSKQLTAMSSQVADVKNGLGASTSATTAMNNTIAAISSNLTTARGDIGTLQTAITNTNAANAKLLADNATAVKAATDDLKTWLVGVILIQILMVVILLLLVKKVMATPPRRPYNKSTGLQVAAPPGTDLPADLDNEG